MPILAIGAVDLIALLVALAAILSVAALWVFFQPLKSIFNVVHIPGTSFSLGNAIETGLETAMHGVILAYSALSSGAAHALWAAGVGAWHVLYNVTHGITQALGLANQAVSAAGAVAAQLPIDISGAISSANSYADGVLATAEADAGRLVAGAEAHATSLFNTAISHADGLVEDAEAQADSQFVAAEAQATSLFNTAISHADGLFQQATADLQADISTAVAHTDALFDTSITHADDLFNQALQDLTDTVGALGVGAIAAEIAGVIPRVATLEAEAAECLEPLCDTITPNAPSLGRIGQFLTNLETLGVDAFIIALATEAVTDPQAVVTDITTVVNDVGGPIMTGFRDLIGV